MWVIIISINIYTLLFVFAKVAEKQFCIIAVYLHDTKVYPSMKIMHQSLFLFRLQWFNLSAETNFSFQVVEATGTGSSCLSIVCHCNTSCSVIIHYAAWLLRSSIGWYGVSTEAATVKGVVWVTDLSLVLTYRLRKKLYCLQENVLVSL